MIRAKFKCVSKVTGVSGDSMMRMVAVTSNEDGTSNEENKSFSKYTPSGELQMRLSAECQAHDQIHVGASYYLDIKQAD